MSVIRQSVKLGVLLDVIFCIFHAFNHIHLGYDIALYLLLLLLLKMSSVFLVTLILGIHVLIKIRQQHCT